MVSRARSPEPETSRTSPTPKRLWLTVLPTSSLDDSPSGARVVIDVPVDSAVASQSGGAWLKVSSFWLAGVDWSKSQEAVGDDERVE